MIPPPETPSGGDASVSEQLPDGNRLSRTLRLVGFVLLALPVVLMALVPSRILRVNALGFDTVLLGEWVPSLVAPVSLCFWGGVLCSTTAPLVGVWGRGRWSRRAMRVLSPIIICSTGLLSVTAVVGLLLDQDHAVLDGTSPGGCRVVIATSFAGLDGIDISIGVVQPGAIDVRWLVLQDHEEPGATSGLSVAWDGAHGSLVLGPHSHPESDLDTVPITCRA